LELYDQNQSEALKKLEKRVDEIAQEEEEKKSKLEVKTDSLEGELGQHREKLEEAEKTFKSNNEQYEEMVKKLDKIQQDLELKANKQSVASTFHKKANKADVEEALKDSLKAKDLQESEKKLNDKIQSQVMALESKYKQDFTDLMQSHRKKTERSNKEVSEQLEGLKESLKVVEEDANQKIVKCQSGILAQVF